MQLTVTIGAGQTVQYTEANDFFRLLSSASSVDLRFYAAGRLVVESLNVNAGYAEKFKDQFDRVDISSALSQSVQFVTRLGNEVRYEGNVSITSGSVAISNMSGAFTSAGVTVTNASTQISAAKARRYLAIQNNDSSGIIYLNLAGAAATTANSIKVPQGGNYILDQYCPSGAITAIGSLASNANIVIVEG